jgi:hypothetical protein
MPDHDIDELFTTFRTGGRLVIPSGPAAARQVSRRRDRRRNALTGAAVALLVAVPIIGYGLFSRGILTWDPNGHVGGTPTASAPASTTSSASATPSTTTPSVVEPTDVPAATVLQASDLPAGYVHQGDVWPGDTTFTECSPGGRSDGLPPSLTLPASVDSRATWFSASGQSKLVNEMVSRYTATDASSYMDTIRAIVAYCGGSWAIGAQSFAGDDSFTIHTDTAPTLTYIFVRTGSLVAQILYDAIDDTDPVVIGQRAAERLCAGTTAC